MPIARRARMRFDLTLMGRAPQVASPQAEDRIICPLCERPIPPGARASRHHLTPKLKGGAKGATVLLHQICHSAIHARYSEAEIARRLSDVESLRREPAMAEFLAWIRTKPDDFHAPTVSTRGRRAARRERDGKRL